MPANRTMGRNRAPEPQADARRVKLQAEDSEDPSLAGYPRTRDALKTRVRHRGDMPEILVTELSRTSARVKGALKSLTIR